jgi:tetratricopeptide (TPR) repeat protein
MRRRSVRAWIVLGQLEAERGRSKAALARGRACRRSTARAGRSVYPHIESAYAALDRSRDFEAFLRALLEERGDDLHARLALARALAARGEIEEALAELRRLLERDPGAARRARGARSPAALRAPRSRRRPRNTPSCSTCSSGAVCCARGSGSDDRRPHREVRARHADDAPVPRDQGRASRRDRLLPDGRLLRDVPARRRDRAPLLDIQLTTRDKNKPDAVPMCGVPCTRPTSTSRCSPTRPPRSDLRAGRGRARGRRAASWCGARWSRW